MATVGSKVLCKYLNNLTLFQFLERTIRDSHRINMKNWEGPTECMLERAQITTANFQENAKGEIKTPQGYPFGSLRMLRGNLPGALSCLSLSLHLSGDKCPLPVPVRSALLLSLESRPGARATRMTSHQGDPGCSPCL